MLVFCKYDCKHVLRPCHVLIHDYRTIADTTQSHSNGRPTVRALCTVHHCSSCASYVGLAQKRTHSGAGQCEVCKLCTVKDKAMAHNGTPVYCCEVRNMYATCFMHMHVGNSEESSSAMAEWVVFDAVRHNGGLSHAIFSL